MQICTIKISQFHLPYARLLIPIAVAITAQSYVLLRVRALSINGYVGLIVLKGRTDNLSLTKGLYYI